MNHRAYRQKESKAERSEWRVLDWLIRPTWVDSLFEAGRFPEAIPHWETELLKPLRTFLDTPGKGLRKELVELGWFLAGGDEQPPIHLMAGVELLHAGSLIIDDVQDNSLTRRGQPCLHRTMGIGPALNLGNWLYFVAVHIMGFSSDDDRKRLNILEAVNRTLIQCHNGQALDLSLKVDTLDQGKIPELVMTTTQLKTGALTALALRLGGLYSGRDEQYDAQISEIGESLGIALQMYDDLSGIINPKKRHKGLEDFRAARPTWPWAWLADEMDSLEFARFQLRCRNSQTQDEINDCLLGFEKNLGHAQSMIETKLDTAQVHMNQLKPDGMKQIDAFVERLKTSYL